MAQHWESQWGRQWDCWWEWLWEHWSWVPQMELKKAHCLGPGSRSEKSLAQPWGRPWASPSGCCSGPPWELQREHELALRKVLHLELRWAWLWAHLKVTSLGHMWDALMVQLWAQGWESQWVKKWGRLRELE